MYLRRVDSCLFNRWYIILYQRARACERCLSPEQKGILSSSVTNEGEDVCGRVKGGVGRGVPGGVPYIHRCFVVFRNALITFYGGANRCVVAGVGVAVAAAAAAAVVPSGAWPVRFSWLFHSRPTTSQPVDVDAPLCIHTRTQYARRSDL